MGNVLRLMRLFRTIARERGRRTEDRFFRIFEHGYIPDNYPTWFYGFRAQTPREDREGIDAVAFTDMGKLYLQIKGSYAGALKFREQQEKYRKRRIIGLLIIRSDDTDETIIWKTRKVLSETRQKVLTLRI